LQILGPLPVWRNGAEVDAGPRQQALLPARARALAAERGAPVFARRAEKFLAALEQRSSPE